LKEQMFETGGALYGTFIFAVLFVAIVLAMQVRREGAKDTLGQHKRTSAVYKSFLPGFSFGSEMLAVASLWSSALNFALPIMLFRLLHVLAGIAILGAIFGSSRFATRLETNVIGFRKCSTLTHLLDHGFSRANIPLLGLHCLLCLCDVTMVQFLPWKRSAFQTQSKGYPTMSVMKVALLVKAVQATVTVICQVAYLVENISDTVDTPTTSPQAKALFSLNIVFSIVGVVMSLLLLFIKKKLLSEVEDANGSGGDNSGTSDAANTPSSAPATAVELHDLYQSGGTDDSGNTSNPMHPSTGPSGGSSSDNGSCERISALEKDFIEARQTLSSMTAAAVETVVEEGEQQEV
jgi:hypothetical protein